MVRTITPPAPSARIDALDAVRGVAVLGILLINIDAFSGYAFITDAQRRALPMSALDEPVWFLLAVAIEAKFYSLFSFLFGIGFAIFVQHAAARGDNAVRLFKRRLVGLLFIGLAHAVFIWMGDILVTYAVLGFGLIPFLRRDDRTVLRWALAMLAAPIFIYAGFVAAAALALPPAASGDGALPPILLNATDKFASGSYPDVVEGNLVFTAANIGRRLLLMFYPRVFGMFLLGLYVGRRAIFADLEGHRPLLVKTTVLGLTFGLPFAMLGAVLGSDVPAVPGVVGLVETTAKSISAPALALAYAAGCALLFQRAHGPTKAFAAVGRTALSNYLLQSVAGVVVFYGIGFGLFRRVPLTVAAAGALAFFGVQILLSALWLARAQLGPAEWLWRVFTYGRRFPLLRK